MKIFKKIFKGNTLYYPGCLTKFVLKDIQERYRKILEKEGIEFVMLKDKELCCGSPLKNAGAESEFREIAEKNFQVFKEHGVDRIISNCPACTAVFKIDYREVLGEKWDIEVKHATEIIRNKKTNTLVSGQNAKNFEREVTYHDPCHLGRTLGIYDKPREIIEAKGYKLKEMDLCREKAYCCGGGGGVRSNNHELAKKIAEDRIAQAKKTGSGCLLTSCPMCFANLKENSGGLEVKELSEILE